MKIPFTYRYEFFQRISPIIDLNGQSKRYLSLIHLADLVSSLDWKNVNYLIDILGLLTLLTDDFDWKQEIISCLG